MLELEIVAVRCPECEQMVLTGENHACWSQDQEMRAFEDAMWGKWKQENAIEPVLPEQVDYYTFDLKQGEKVI